MFLADRKELEFIASFEGVRYKRYKDSKGFDTIGIGHLIKVSEPHLLGVTLTHEQVEELFYKDLAPNEKWLNTVSANWKKPITRNEFTALISFLHQYPIHKYKNTKQAIIIGNRQLICSQMMLFRDAEAAKDDNQMLKRREKEIALFNTPD
jgi:GH24 family phage-related lysozyme (muramidase)